MRFACSRSTTSDTLSAVAELVSDVRQQLAGEPVSFAVLFVSADHAAQEATLGRLIGEQLGNPVLLGCTAETVVGGDRELESPPAASLWCASLPGVPLHPFAVTFERTLDGFVCHGFPSASDVSFTPTTCLFLADPFTCPVDAVIGQLADEFPGLPLLGGMASGARTPGDNRLYAGDGTREEGGVGVLLGPGVRVTSVVSQGSRPVGNPFIVTKGRDNVIAELGGLPAVQRLHDVFTALPARDRTLLQQGPQIGIAMTELREKFAAGDFLIANLFGVDRETGALTLGNHIRTGQTVQFHVRDAETADADLRVLLARAIEQLGEKPRAGLLFSCNGRGTRLFDVADHDAGVIQELAGPLPLAGLFAQGELGPVGGKNYIHGYTASVALFSAE